MDGVTEGKSDIITTAVNRFMTHLIIINNNTMLLLHVSEIQIQHGRMLERKAEFAVLWSLT
jgi:hypothetical protein